MSTFSERHNYSESRTVIQYEALDEETRIALWNLMFAHSKMLENEGNVGYYPEDQLGRLLWADFLKKPIDEFNYPSRAWALAKPIVLEGDWYETYDLVEFLLLAQPLARHHSELARTVNLELENKLAGYRVISGKVVPVDSEAAASAITDALLAASAQPLAGVRHHLATAIELLADRPKADCPNSVKESISAVEAVCEIVTGEGVLSKALPKLAGAGMRVHPAQVEGWKKLYGWTSDEDGVRHSAKAIPEVDQATAKYMLVICSAFVSLLIEEARKAGVAGF